MEKLTTDNQEYFSRIVEELTEFECEAKFIYCEVGQLLTHGYSFLFQDKSDSFVRMKFWNSSYDNKRFGLGIFNLDRLAITEREVAMNQDETIEIKQLLEKEIHTIETERIVLDGLHCQLLIEDRKLEWNIDDHMNQNLSKLIGIIRGKARAEGIYE